MHISLLTVLMLGPHSPKNKGVGRQTPPPPRILISAETPLGS